MFLTIDEMYQAAAKGVTSWEHALLLTGLLYVGVEGLMVSPPPQDKYEYHFYKLRPDVLIMYSNNNYVYKKVIKALHKYLYK